jgi:prevent-host-death family protein
MIMRASLHPVPGEAGEPESGAVGVDRRGGPDWLGCRTELTRKIRSFWALSGDRRMTSFMAIIAIKVDPMRSVNIAELKNRLSTYVTFARGGEEIIIRDRNLPVAKLIPFSAEGASDDELMLVAAGKMRLPEVPLDTDELWKIKTGSVEDSDAIAALLQDRNEGP